jgi:hypothetical protein
MAGPDRELVLDFDGVLADTNGEKARLIKARWDKVVDPRRCCRTFCVPHILNEEQYRSVGDVVYSPSYTPNIPAVRGAIDAVVALNASGWRVVVLTARPGERQTAARRWLDSRLGPVAPEVHSSAGLGRTKTDWAAERGALAIVEDDPRHLATWAVRAPRRVLLNPPEDYVPPVGIAVVREWDDLLECLQVLA